MADIKRRGFVAGILAAGIAPAFISSKVLMPVRKIWTPPTSMANPPLLTISMITNEALRFLESDLVFYDKWGSPVVHTITIRKPRRKYG
jgi:hypothetical protein